MNKLIPHEVLIDLKAFSLLPKFIRGRELNIDCYWVDQRRHRRLMRRYKRRTAAIKTALSYKVIKDEKIDFSNNLYQTPVTEKSLEAMLQEFWGGDYKIKPTRFVVPPWVVEEIEAEFGSPATEEKYHKWNIARLKLTEPEYWAIISK
jgi:hypothetical protein